MKSTTAKTTTPATDTTKQDTNTGKPETSTTTNQPANTGKEVKATSEMKEPQIEVNGKFYTVGEKVLSELATLQNRLSEATRDADKVTYQVRIKDLQDKVVSEHKKEVYRTQVETLKKSFEVTTVNIDNYSLTLKGEKSKVDKEISDLTVQANKLGKELALQREAGKVNEETQKSFSNIANLKAYAKTKSNSLKGQLDTVEFEHYYQLFQANYSLYSKEIIIEVFGFERYTNLNNRLARATATTIKTNSEKIEAMTKNTIKRNATLTMSIAKLDSAKSEKAEQAKLLHQLNNKLVKGGLAYLAVLEVIKKLNKNNTDIKAAQKACLDGCSFCNDAGLSSEAFQVVKPKQGKYIALCRDCHSEYKDNHREEEYTSIEVPTRRQLFTQLSEQGLDIAELLK